MTDDGPEVVTSGDRGNAPRNALAQDIALALMGAGSLSPDQVAADVTWDGPGGAVTGRDRLIKVLGRSVAPDRIHVDQVVTHGRSGSVSGRLWRGEEERLFCHVIRFTTAAARQVAQLVSFEHRVRRR